MLERLPGIEARIAEIERRLKALDASPAAAAPTPAERRPAFSHALEEACRPGKAGALPPAPVAVPVSVGKGAVPYPVRDGAMLSGASTVPSRTEYGLTGALGASASEPVLPPPPHWLQGAAGDREAEAMVRDAALRHGVEPSLAAAVARAESGFNPRAVSSAGAVGLMQLMPDTARSLGVTDPFDPDQNADGGVRYLAEQLRRFGDVRSALAAYNAGPARVADYGGVPPIGETERYIQRVLEFQRQYQREGAP